MKLGKFRSESGQMAEQVRLNRIARTTPITAKAPTDGIVSSAEMLAKRLDNLFDVGQSIAGAFRIDAQAIWEEMLNRSRGQR